MTAVLLTDELIKSLLAPERNSRITFDTEIKGFGIRITKANARAFVLNYARKGDGLQRRLTIGAFGAWTTKQARGEAKRLRREIDLGGDPLDDDSPPLREDQIADKALELLQHGITPACYLYRHYHPNGDLLYVGISLHALTRQNQHASKAPWAASICKILIEPFATREKALAAEEFAIRTEFPRFNLRHNARRSPLQEINHIMERPQ
jgi:hypothetical protein